MSCKGLLKDFVGLKSLYWKGFVHWHRKKIAIPERYGQISMWPRSVRAEKAKKLFHRWCYELQQTFKLKKTFWQLFMLEAKVAAVVENLRIIDLAQDNWSHTFTDRQVSSSITILEDLGDCDYSSLRSGKIRDP